MKAFQRPGAGAGDRGYNRYWTPCATRSRLPGVLVSNVLPARLWGYLVFVLYLLAGSLVIAPVIVLLQLMIDRITMATVLQQAHHHRLALGKA